MASVKANWHNDAALTDLAGEDDPFGDQLDVTRLGKPIDLRDGAELNERFVALMNQEAELDALGISCAIKNNRGTCSACPIRHHDHLDNMTALCEIGMQQERIQTAVLIYRERAGLLAA